jgi:hypothetical protein
MSSDHEVRQVLADVRRLRLWAASRAHGGVWLPVTALAALVVLSIGLYRAPFHHPQEMTVAVPYWAGLPAEQRAPIASYAFWFLGTAAVFALITMWYRQRARRTGMRVAWQRAVTAGFSALLALAVIAAVPVQLPQDVPLATVTARPPSAGAVLLHGLLTPLLPLAVAVVVLGLVEHSRALVAAGAWVGLLTWIQCTVGILAVPALLEGYHTSSAQFDLLPGPLLLTMAFPLLLFAAVTGARSARTARTARRG